MQHLSKEQACFSHCCILKEKMIIDSHCVSAEDAMGETPIVPNGGTMKF